jgi:putative membrane protein
MMDGWDWFWGTLMMLVFWGGLAAVVVFAVRAFGAGSRRGSGEGPSPDARTILENRFARGEISEDEFEQRKRVLASSMR